MWFKNIILLRFTEPFPLSADLLEEQLAQAVFQPCASHIMSSQGWTPPLGRRATALTHAVGDCMLMCLKTEEKLAPAAVIREIAADRAAALEQQLQRPLYRRELEQLRNDILHELLPRALTRNRRQFAYIDRRNGWLAVNSVSRKTVERLTGALRQALGGLPVAPLRVAASPAAAMTAWLLGRDLNAEFTLGDECVLQGQGEGQGVVRCQRQDLGGAEILAHLRAGKQATRLALVWKQRLAFVLTEELAIRRLRFLEVVKERLEHTDTPEQLLDVQFALMTAELGALIPDLMAALGGLAPDA